MTNKSVKIIINERKPLSKIKKKNKPRTKRPNIMNKNQKIIEKQIIEKIKVSKSQRELEESIKNKDFSKYDKLQNFKKTQDIRLKIDNLMRIITLLKEGFNNAKNKVEEYDPNNIIVENVVKESDLLIDTLETKLNKIILFRSRIDKLNDNEKRQINTMESDVDRYSNDLEKINILIKKLDPTKKLNIDEIDLLKKQKKIKEEQKKLDRDVDKMFVYGYSENDINNINDIINDPEKLLAFENIIKDKMTKYNNDISRLDEKIDDLNSISLNIQENRKNIGVNSHSSGKYIDVYTINKYIKEVRNITIEVENISNILKNIKIYKIEDVKIIFNTIHTKITETEKKIDELITYGENLEKYIKNTDNKTLKVSNVIKELKNNSEILFNGIDTLYKISNMYKYFTPILNKSTSLNYKNIEFYEDIMNKQGSDGEKISNSVKFNVLLKDYKDYLKRVIKRGEDIIKEIQSFLNNISSKNSSGKISIINENIDNLKDINTEVELILKDIERINYTTKNLFEKEYTIRENKEEDKINKRNEAIRREQTKKREETIRREQTKKREEAINIEELKIPYVKKEINKIVNNISNNKKKLIVIENDFKKKISEFKNNIKNLNKNITNDMKDVFDILKSEYESYIKSFDFQINRAKGYYNDILTLTYKKLMNNINNTKLSNEEKMNLIYALENVDYQYGVYIRDLEMSYLEFNKNIGNSIETFYKKLKN